MIEPAGDATRFCEAILRADRRYNEDHAIWPSQNRVIDKLLARGPELHRAYGELFAKLAPHSHALEEFFRVLLSTASLWRPERIVESRRQRDRLEEVNKEIASSANTLADLLDERSELQDRSSFHAGTFYGVVSWPTF